MNLQGKKVMVMGLGLNDGGLGAVKYALSNQVLELIITDSKTSDILKPTIDKINLLPNNNIPIKYILGQQNSEDYTKVDIIIKNPGVPNNSPYLEVARKAGVSITTDVELFFEHIDSLEKPPTVIGITGTRGKSTTTALIHHILSNFYGKEKVLLGGNIRKSILNLVSDIQQNSYIVLELSSFQLDNIKYSPHIGVFTSFFADHLDRYNSIDEYFESKTNIVAFQNKADFAILNIDNERISNLATQIKSRLTTYSLYNKNANIHIDEESYIIYNDDKIIHIKDISLFGEHNQYNVMAAIGVANIIGVDKNVLVQSLKSFRGIEGRQQSLGFVNGVEIINDTTSTMPVALKVAMDTFQDKPYILICGGEDKGLDYSELSQHNCNNLKAIVLLPGSASLLIKRYIFKVSIYEVKTLAEAVSQSFVLAMSGDRIVFSPGATSFGMFLNEFDRGDKFIALIQAKKDN
ncbi:MAG: UDP-N-acetylmuramoyl-L-alanine--D-glutamate ligase [Minisyncoccia bacterium]